MQLTLIPEDEINTEVEVAQSGNTKINLLQGNCLEILKTLQAESIDCCVTSPPYYGLRDYGNEPYIWGGDSKCTHEWGDNNFCRKRGSIGDKSTFEGGTANQKCQGIGIDQGQFCQLCGAWRGSLGLEPTPELYVEHLVMIFREVRRTLKKTGTLWMNLGDSYNGSGGEHKHDKGQSGLTNNRDKVGWVAGRNLTNLKPKDLIGIPWMSAFALRADGWWLRQDIIWAKGCSGVYSGGSVMPESVRDRFTTAHEYLFLLSKSAKYYFDQEAIKEKSIMKPQILHGKIAYEPPGAGEHRKGTQYLREEVGQDCTDGTRNRRSVWTINPEPTKEAHFATFPTALIVPCIKAGCPGKCCPKCDAPWERVVERKIGQSKECPKTQLAHEARGGTGIPTGTIGKSGGGRINGYTQTIGFSPTCNCNEQETIPGTVLDPFLGSGTTAMVSRQLGRNCIGIELNPEYLKIAKRRINNF